MEWSFYLLDLTSFVRSSKKSATHVPVLTCGSIIPNDKWMNALNSLLLHRKLISSVSNPTYLNFPRYHLHFPPLGFVLLKKEKNIVSL